jgi:hypothetical protein
MFRRFARALVLAGGLTAGGALAAAIGAGVNPAAALASTAHTLSTAVLANPTTMPAAGTHTCTHSGTHTRTHTGIHVGTHTCTHSGTHTHTHTCTHSGTHTRTHAGTALSTTGTATF